MIEVFDSDLSDGLELSEITPLMKEAYKGIDPTFTPRKQEADAFVRVIDSDYDGKIGIHDLERYIMKVFQDDLIDFSEDIKPGYFGRVKY